jgi:hypothetical protein
MATTGRRLKLMNAEKYKSEPATRARGADLESVALAETSSVRAARRG